ncbi:MAG TPA: IPT/TIG domain-containing protein [Kofleriaceae bacterium]|nr:IPT/TIG domain-containing protein [Kofleriaceae bacterium]
MTRGIQLTAIWLIVAFAAPASAQNVRDHRRKRPQPAVAVNGFSPQNGAVGTEVAIAGTGFTPETRVIFGRTEVRPSSVTPTRLTVRVPDAHGDGAIVLRHPGVSSDIQVGRFSVELGLTVTGFAPASGVAGTRILIHGSGFGPGVRVVVGAVELPVVRVTPTGITVRLPDSAGSGVISVISGTQRADTAQPFNVLTPAPVIDSISPEGGSGATQVRINGRNFGPDVRVLYGRTNMAIVARGPTFIDAQVPSDANEARFIFVSGPSGEARSPRKFQLEPMPAITDIRPRFGIAGERVEITGLNFRAGDRVSIEGRPMRILQLRATAISVVVPNDARSGPLVVERGAYRAASQQVFEFLEQPAIVRIDPPGAPIGARVEIVGTALGADAEVFYGPRKLPVVARNVGKAGRDRLTVIVPRDADDRFFTVRTRAGETRSQLFVVHRYPRVTEAMPQRGFAGTLVTIRGADVQHATQVMLGAVPVPIVERGADFIVVEISGAAKDGTFALTSFGQRFETKLPFDVIPTPAIDDFQPRSGPPATEVVISGQNLSRTTRVFFGKTELAVLRVVPERELTVRIPQNARGSELLFVGETNAIVPSSHPFVVVEPASSGKVRDHRKKRPRRRP